MKRFVLAAAAVAFVSVAFRPADGPRIAVVDMSKLISQNHQSQAEQALIKDWKDASEKLLDKLDKDFKTSQGALDQFKPGSDDYRKKQMELEVENFKLKQQAKALNDELNSRVSASLVDAHARVTKACKEYLAAHDLDVILQYTSTPVGGASPNEVYPDIVVRAVVAYRDALDVTDAVLALLH
jgi:Skp family chaperone for outer membrane proteins